MFSRRIVRISVVAALAFCAAATGGSRAARRGDRQDHAAEPRGAGGGRQARVREGARAAEARAGHVQGRRPRTAPGGRAHARPHGRRHHPGLQEPRARQEAVREGAGDRSEHHDHEVAVDARSRGGVRRGEGRAAARWPAAATTTAARRRRRPPASRDPDAAATRTEAPSSSGFSYHTVSEVKQGSSIIVTVTVEESLKFSKLVLAYREQGTSDFLGREMEPVGDGAYRAEIPASATDRHVGRLLHGGAGRRGQPGRVARHETRPLVISFAATREAVVGTRRRDRRAEGRSSAQARRGRRRSERRQVFRQPAGGQRRRLHVGQRARSTPILPVSGTFVGRAARAHRARGRLLAEARPDAVAAGALPAGHRADRS